MSTLKDELKAAFKYNKSRWPEDLVRSVKAKYVIEGDIVDATRWGHIVDDIVTRTGREEGLNYVRIRYEVASGDGDCPFTPVFTDAIPQEVTLTKWVERR